jgi:lysozyme
MQHLINYNDYILKETINWFDYEVLKLNESNINKLSKIWNDLLNKAKKLNKNNKTKLYSYTLTALLALYSYGELKKVIGDNDPQAIEVLDDLKKSKPIIDYTKNIEDFKSKDSINQSNNMIEDTNEDDSKLNNSNEYKNPLQLKVSSKGRKMIKWHEGSAKQKGEPVLNAYDLKDGRITVGWGHAERKRKSKFKIGQKITKEKAQELFQQDIQDAADGVRRIFKKWEEKGINVKLTQDQFDALVSITFNAGIGNVRMSDFIQSIKKNNLKKAGEQILKFNISNKFSGLEKRRKDEAKPFLGE